VANATSNRPAIINSIQFIFYCCIIVNCIVVYCIFVYCILYYCIIQ
jgi:hypothetical protein